MRTLQSSCGSQQHAAPHAAVAAAPAAVRLPIRCSWQPAKLRWPAAAGPTLHATRRISVVRCAAAGDDGEPVPDVVSTRRRRRRDAGDEPAPGAGVSSAGAGSSLKQEAAASNQEVCDKLVDVFSTKDPADWRKLIAYSKQWPVLAQGVFDRIEERASAAGEEEERLALRRLGRRLASVHEELSLYQHLIDKFRAAPSRDWEGMVSLQRNSLGQEFFKYLDLRVKAAKDNQKEQEALMALGAQLVALVEAFDRVLEDERAMSAAAESFGSLLEVDSLEEADRKIDELAASGRLDPALLLMMAKAYAGAKETDATREEVKDIMAHLYFKAKESFARQAPKEVRILKHLLVAESESERMEMLEEAFEEGPELETADVDYLCTTPPALLNTIENVLQLYDSSTRRATMAGEAASLMNPEVIEKLRALQKQIRKRYM